MNRAPRASGIEASEADRSLVPPSRATRDPSRRRAIGVSAGAFMAPTIYELKFVCHKTGTIFGDIFLTC